MGLSPSPSADRFRAAVLDAASHDRVACAHVIRLVERRVLGAAERERESEISVEAARTLARLRRIAEEVLA